MIKNRTNMTEEVREGMRGGTGKVTIRHYFTSDEFSAPVRLCAQLKLEPGASIGPHTHEREDEVYIVTRGSGILDDGATRRAVGVGDAVLTGNGESHSIENDGDETLELVAMIACYPA